MLVMVSYLQKTVYLSVSRPYTDGRMATVRTAQASLALCFIVVIGPGKVTVQRVNAKKGMNLQWSTLELCQDLTSDRAPHPTHGGAAPVTEQSLHSERT